MSAALTAHLLALCAGKGTLALKGAGTTRRPWLEIRRCESERTYLDHQLRRLRKLHQGQLRAVLDPCPSSGFYGMLRLRAGSEQFHRAYELLYPGDLRRWSPRLIQLAGTAGVAQLWLDHGKWESLSTGKIKPPWSTGEILEWCAALCDRKIRCAPVIETRTGKIRAIRLGVSGMEELIQQIRPMVHRSMRDRLWARKMLSGQLR